MHEVIGLREHTKNRDDVEYSRQPAVAIVTQAMLRFVSDGIAETTHNWSCVLLLYTLC